MNTYRLYCDAINASSLNTDAILKYIPCDRNATLTEVVIVSRAGITAASVNFSKLQNVTISNPNFQNMWNI